MRMIKDGQVIYCSNESKRIELQCNILKKYFDYFYINNALAVRFTALEFILNLQLLFPFLFQKTYIPHQ